MAAAAASFMKIKAMSVAVSLRKDDVSRRENVKKS
jgi:hypothetical protein